MILYILLSRKCSWRQAVTSSSLWIVRFTKALYKVCLRISSVCMITKPFLISSLICYIVWLLISDPLLFFYR
nr:MAG TPA: hypothetical protein [Caudoviricetes sp.]